ncbi:acyl-CoA dehydratase activase-related protein [Desulfotomaculum copahuensis]|nr:acyl-CoA dehydratase activase-related protein [Desulfotomaculum copahuensis]
MKPKVGIPRALLYYYYFPLWRAFFQSLGAEVSLSGPTNKTVLGRGLKQAGDDVCLPVKLAFGHILELAGRVDYLFLPRLVSVAPGEYICPKFLGLPDMVRQTVDGLPPLIDTTVDLYRRHSSLWPTFARTGQRLKCGRWLVYAAYRRALAEQGRFESLLRAGRPPEQAMALAARDGNEQPPETAEQPLVAVIGHPYNIYDHYISMNLLQRLRAAGVRPVTAEMLSEETVRREAATLPKRLFWTLSRRMTGAAFYYLRDARVQGMIHVASFACGPDSITGELIERRARREGHVPFLNLTLDEHTGEAGVVTRLEAFLDMLQRCRGGGVPAAGPCRDGAPAAGTEETAGRAGCALPALVPSAAGGGNFR